MHFGDRRWVGLLLALPVLLSAQGRAAAGSWRLRWSDEFSGPAGAAPDVRTWAPDTGDGCARGICGWGNQERQTYTAERANAALTGRGTLAITARPAGAGRTCWYGPCRYTSARLTSKGRVEVGYGRVVARIRLPKGQGIWPAFWMLGASYPETGWPQCGELDVMEFAGSRMSTNSSAIHGPGYSGQTPLSNRYVRSDVDYSKAFHRFAVERDERTIRFLVDDSVHYAVTRADVERHGAWVFDGPFFVILNVAVGGGFDGDPASDAVLPAEMLVDWVRVYERRR